jgi:hypothetical protein
MVKNHKLRTLRILIGVGLVLLGGLALKYRNTNEVTLKVAEVVIEYGKPLIITGSGFVTGELGPAISLDYLTCDEASTFTNEFVNWFV